MDILFVSNTVLQATSDPSWTLREFSAAGNGKNREGNMMNDTPPPPFLFFETMNFVQGESSGNKFPIYSGCKLGLLKNVPTKIAGHGAGTDAWHAALCILAIIDKGIPWIQHR